MSASVTSIAPPRGTLDPLRVALAAAQQAEKDAKRAVGERETAIVRARELVAAAEAALEKTRAGVQAARAEHARRIADGLARGAAPSIAGATRMARAAEADAEDVLEPRATRRRSSMPARRTCGKNLHARGLTSALL